MLFAAMARVGRHPGTGRGRLVYMKGSSTTMLELLFLGGGSRPMPFSASCRRTVPICACHPAPCSSIGSVGVIGDIHEEILD